MGATTGVAVIGDYSTPATPALKVAALLDLIPNPDAGTNGTGAIAGGSTGKNSYLDEMSPAAATQLRVEIAALAAAEGAAIASGQHTVTGAEATANVVVIATGLPDITLANGAVVVRRAGTVVTADAVITESPAGSISVADGSTYNTTAADVITWMAKP